MSLLLARLSSTSGSTDASPANFQLVPVGATTAGRSIGVVMGFAIIPVAVTDVGRSTASPTAFQLIATQPTTSAKTSATATTASMVAASATFSGSTNAVAAIFNLVPTAATSSSLASDASPVFFGLFAVPAMSSYVPEVSTDDRFRGGDPGWLAYVSHTPRRGRFPPKPKTIEQPNVTSSASSAASSASIGMPLAQVSWFATLVIIDDYVLSISQEMDPRGVDTELPELPDLDDPLEDFVLPDITLQLEAFELPDL